MELKLPGQIDGESIEATVHRLLAENNIKDVSLPTLSKDGIDALYAFAYGFYQTGNYEKAVHFFRFLTMVDMGNRRNWMGLGAAYHLLKQYERALQCYGQAAILNPDEPYAHWHAAECFLALKNTEQAAQALNSVELTAKAQPKKYKVLLNRLEILKKGNSKAAKVKKNKS